MNKIVIELFPAEKSCPQGCPPCPLAKKDHAARAECIDSQVQKTFSLLEKAIAEMKRNYLLYYLGPVFEDPPFTVSCRI